MMKSLRSVEDRYGECGRSYVRVLDSQSAYLDEAGLDDAGLTGAGSAGALGAGTFTGMVASMASQTTRKPT